MIFPLPEFPVSASSLLYVNSSLMTPCDVCIDSYLSQQNQESFAWEIVELPQPLTHPGTLKYDTFTLQQNTKWAGLRAVGIYWGSITPCCRDLEGTCISALGFLGTRISVLG